MVLQILADAGQRVRHRGAGARQMRGVAAAGEWQDMRRADRSAREDDFARRLGLLDFTAARKLNRGRALAVEQHAMYQRIGDDAEVRALQCRAQIGARSALAPAAAPRLLHPADAVLPAMRQTRSEE